MPTSLEKAWDFFSSPLNLVKITPPEVAFKVTSGFKEGTKMYPGMIITYKLSPFGGIRINWVTEITHVKENEYFVDEQRSGPYALWHHQHHFKEVERGVWMTDLIQYAMPCGFIGKMVNSLLVKDKLKKIFDYREEAIVKLFGP
jgi:ligand-binding SRPBCC domain-containing protein